MKDQRLLFRKSQLNNIPAIIIQGRDRCAAEILSSAEDIYRKNGCSTEFLFDFHRLRRDFEIYSTEYRDNLILPKADYIIDKHILNECIYQDIPVIVFQGTDGCAAEILKSAEKIYLKNGCDQEFLAGFQSYITSFEEYAEKNMSDIKLPKLSESEKDFVMEDMEYEFISAVDKKDVAYLEHLGKLGYQPSDDIMLSAMNKDPFVIGYFENLSERVQLAAIDKSAYAIQGISNPTDRVLISAIRKSPGVFELIDRPSEKVKIEAVKIDPNCLAFIPDPSKEVVLAATIADPEIFRYCNNIPNAVIKEVVEPYIDFKESVENHDFAQLIKLKEQGYLPSKQEIQSLSSSFSGSTSVAVQKIFGIEMSAIPTAQLVLDLTTDGIQLARNESVGSGFEHHLSSSVEQSI